MVGLNERGIVGVPRVPAGMLPRAALRARIGRTPLTVVRAPGGSGKTVLLAQWAGMQTTPGTWVTVEPGIAQRTAFWSAALDGLPLDDAGDDDGALRRSLVQAFHRLGDFALVIDDAHELGDPVVDDLLAVLHACPGVVAVVGTRTRGELEAPRVPLTLDVAVIAPEELVLSLDEVAELAASHETSGTAADLLTASGGNPLLLRAILAGGGAGRRGRRATMDDHLRHLFAGFGADVATFAAAAAVPDDVDLPLAAHLGRVGVERAAELLDGLEVEGLVMRRDAAGGIRHRFHPLVRDVLREGLRREHPEEYRRASLLASAAAEAGRQYIAALRHAVDAEDYSLASDIVLHGGIALLRSRGAAAVLQRVPFRYVARLPFLAIVLGLAANARGERLRALELLTLALGASRAGRGRQRVAERVGLALIESVVLRITGRAQDSAAAARRMATLLEDAAPGDLEEIAEQEGAFRYQGALSLFRAGALDEAQLAADRVGVSAHALDRGAPETLGAASLVALIEAARGENLAAAATLARIDASGSPVEQRDGYVGSLAHVARGILALEAGDAVAAEEHADLLRDRVNLEHGMLVVALRAGVELWRGRPEVGVRILDARESTDRPRARLSAQDRRVAAATRVLLNAALGQHAPAHAALRDLDRADQVTTVLEATLLLLEQRPDLVLERLARRGEDAGPRLQAAADLLRASASLQTGSHDLAAAALRRFLATAAVHGVVSPVLVIPEEHRPGLWRLAESVGADPALLARMRALPAPFRSAPMRITLTRREVDVLEQLRDTASFGEIAATLSVSANTVKSQVRTLYRKLDVSTRDEALRVAYRQGLFGD